MTQSVPSGTEPKQRFWKNGSGVTHRCRPVKSTPESEGVEPRNWHFKQVPTIILSHSKFEGYCLKGSHNIDKCGEDLGGMGWVYWTKKYIRVKNICVTCESGANALWSVVQRLENLAFLVQAAVDFSSGLSLEANIVLLTFFFLKNCVAFLSLLIKQFNGRILYSLRV